MMNVKIAAIIVTYNRVDLLLNCLNSIREQSQLPDAIYIIDNYSSDGTPDILFEKKYINSKPENELSSNQTIKNSIYASKASDKRVEIIYIRKFENDGGAGGFYEGMKQAFEAGYDWLWLMDDDGITDGQQLSMLLKYSKKFDIKFSNALVVNINDREKLSFEFGSYKYIREISEDKIVRNQINPFNGTFIHRSVVEKIGYIKKEMFIWGDEREYSERARKNDFELATILEAKHYHPEAKGKMECVIPFFKRYKVIIKPKEKAHIFYRNQAYINIKYTNISITLNTFILYLLYYIFRLKFNSTMMFIKYYYRGLRDDFR